MDNLSHWLLYFSRWLLHHQPENIGSLSSNITEANPLKWSPIPGRFFPWEQAFICSGLHNSCPAIYLSIFPFYVPINRWLYPVYDL